MKVYLALDCSMSILLHSSTNAIVHTKFERAIKFMCGFVKEMTKEGIDVNLVEFSKEPKIVRHDVRTSKDVTDSFPMSIVGTGTPNFLLLRDLILSDNILNNFELILILEPSNYNWIPLPFHLPCSTHFVLLTDFPNSVSSRLISELRSISLEFSPDNEADPLIICKDEDVESALNKIVNIDRLQREATIFLSDEIKIKVKVIPGRVKLPICCYHEQVMKSIDPHPDDDPMLKLIGFTKSQHLLNVNSSPLAHVVKPSDNLDAFHSLAEVLGTEAMVAILQHSGTDEEYALIPFRDDPSKLWVLCLQLIPSSTFKWEPTTSQAAGKKVQQFPEISYKASATPQIHWIDQYGIQSDIQKLHRLLKRTDRIDQFYQEIQRISDNAIAFGYHNFAQNLADILDARCANIPAESKAHLARTTELLRKGGFKLVVETKLSM